MDVRVIDGADHFFHGVSEFDLLDFIEDVLQF
jgi:alpha/beta superfamily hydrolase